MPKVKGALTVAQKLEQFGEDSVIDMIADGQSLAQIARRIGIDRASIVRWVDADSQRSARVNIARRNAAEAYAEKAEDALIGAEDTPLGLQRARELAHHYRWAASKRNPAAFGDRIKAEVAHSGKVDVNLLTDEQLAAIVAEAGRGNDGPSSS